MDKPTANKLDRLLAGGELSAPEAEAIFDRVYAAVAPQEKRGHRALPQLLWAAAALSAAGIGLVLWIAPATTERGELRPRGLSWTGATLEATCSEGPLGACPLSSKLVFAASGDGASGFLSAYAEPLPGTGGERIWYFSREGETPRLSGALEETRAFDRAVKLSGTHRPGRYRVNAFLADRPLRKAEMLVGRPNDVVRSELHTDLIIVGE